MGDCCSQFGSALVSGDETPRGTDYKLKPPGLLSVLFCLISCFCFICVTVSFSLGPVTFLLCMTLVVFYGALGTGEGSAYERGHPSSVFLIPVGIGTVLIPLYIGIKIFVIIYAPYYAAVTGRKYTHVPPTGHPAVYADAGIIRFTSDAALDTSRSYGLMAEDFTYCVAPVVSRSAHIHPQSSGPKISFWAVGLDCCGNRRDFECDGAGETETRNAFAIHELDKDVLTKTLVPRTARPQYLKAVEAAKALHNLRSEDDNEIILVRWAAEPTQILEVWRNRAVIAVALACFLYSVIVTILWTTIHFYFVRDIQKIAAGGKPGAAGNGNGTRKVSDPFLNSRV